MFEQTPPPESGGERGGLKKGLCHFIEVLAKQTTHTVNGGIALGINDGGIDCRGVDAAMAEQFRDGVYVGPSRERHRGIAVAGCVEGDVLGDACRCRPLTQYPRQCRIDR